MLYALIVITIISSVISADYQGTPISQAPHLPTEAITRPAADRKRPPCCPQKNWLQRLEDTSLPTSTYQRGSLVVVIATTVSWSSAAVRAQMIGNIIVYRTSKCLRSLKLADLIY